jgi:hypothetical protein
MSFPQITAGLPCWELPHHADDEWQPHFATEAEAKAAADEEFLTADDLTVTQRAALLVSTPKVRARACVRLVCDGCRNAVGHDGELVPEDDGIHVDPADEAEWLTGSGWTLDRTGRHFCPDCSVDHAAPGDAERIPGPADVGLFS